jgi:hypothetical protein
MTLIGHVLHCVRRHQYNKILFSRVISHGLFLSKIWETFWEGSGKHCFRTRWATRSQLVTHGIGDLILDELPPRCQCKLAYCRPADIGNANDQTGLPFGAAIACAHQGLARGVYKLASPTLPRVTLWGPWGSNIPVDDWRVVVTLTWPWWSLEGSHDRAWFTTTLSSCRVFVVTPQ